MNQPKTPIEMILDGLTWTPMEGTHQEGDDLPHATHEGVLEIGDAKLRCYRLNTGQAVFEASDVEKFFDLMSGDEMNQQREQG